MIQSFPELWKNSQRKGKFTGSKPEQISVVEDLVEWYGPKTTPEKFETAISEAPVVSGCLWECLE